MRTRGQPVALAAVRTMLRTGLPHALLLSGPAGVGTTTLALDLAAALLCVGPVGTGRPCGECRSCRMVRHGNHPDLHRLGPAGPGGLIVIGGRGERGVRDLVADLALMPVEGGARVAIVEAAQRMSEDAQSALLKTLEEPPAGTTLILCADDEERLLPTIRSRCARVRLGTIGPREVEAVLAEQGVADAPAAARLARITGGRPGQAIAYARAPEAIVIRGEISRTLLDLLSAGVTARLAGVRDLAMRATDLVRALDAGAARAAAQASEAPRRGGRARAPIAPGPVAESDPEESPEAVSYEGTAKVPAAERRRGALALLEIWRTVVRDVGLAVVGDEARIRDQDLLDEVRPVAERLDARAVGAVLRRLDVAAEQLEGNVSPELVLDGLALHWSPSGIG